MAHRPSVPLIARTPTNSLLEAVRFLEVELRPGGRFNYLETVKRLKDVYRGLPIRLAVQALPSHLLRVGGKENIDALLAASTFARGRDVRVFDLPSRSLSYAAGRDAAYRTSFFFVENGVVHAHFLQPRKSTEFSVAELSFIATVTKRFLLDQEFYGLPTEIEFVQVNQPDGALFRKPTLYRLGDIEMLTEERVQHQFETVRAALEIIEAENRVPKVQRPLRDPDLPLFR